MFIYYLNSYSLVSIDSWISSLEGDMGKQDSSRPEQNTRPSQNSPSAGVYGARPTQQYLSESESVAQNDWNFAGSKITPTTGKNYFNDINSLYDNTQSAQGKASSNNQGIVNAPTNKSSSGGLVPSKQSGGNGSPAAQTPETNGAISSGTGSSPNQVGGNQGKEVPGTASQTSGGVVNPNSAGTNENSGTNGAKIPGTATSPSQVGENQGKEVPGAASQPAGGVVNPNSAGTNGAKSPGPATGPSQVGGNQGKGVPGAASQAVGVVVSPNSAGTNGNSGIPAGTIGSAVSGPTNPGQPAGMKL